MRTTVLIYTHANGSAQRQAVDRLESLLFPSVPKFVGIGQRPMLVDVTGIEPVTPCLQSTTVDSNPSIHHFNY